MSAGKPTATFLVQGAHGPVPPDEGTELARQARAYVTELQGVGTVTAAWAKAGGGRALVVQVGSRAELDDLLARFPGPDDTTWEVVEVHDLVAGLDAYLEQVESSVKQAEPG